MSGFGSRLTHTVSIIRQTDSGNVDAYGQPITSDAVLSTPRAAIQPMRRPRETTLVNQAGAVVADHVIYLLPTDLSTADAILHDEVACPVTSDLPTIRFEIVGVPNAAGLGHHLEVEARRIGSGQDAEGS